MTVVALYSAITRKIHTLDPKTTLMRFPQRCISKIYCSLNICLFNDDIVTDLRNLFLSISSRLQKRLPSLTKRC